MHLFAIASADGRIEEADVRALAGPTLAGSPRACGPDGRCAIGVSGPSDA
jgi:hypothetical protein